MIVAALSAGLGQITMTRAFRDLPVGEGSLLQILVPLGIAVGGVMFFSEQFAAYEMVGAAMILVGTVLPAALSPIQVTPASGLTHARPVLRETETGARSPA